MSILAPYLVIVAAIGAPCALLKLTVWRHEPPYVDER